MVQRLRHRQALLPFLYLPCSTPSLSAHLRAQSPRRPQALPSPML